MSDGECVVCGVGGCLSEEVQNETFMKGLAGDEVTVRIPVITCTACGSIYTDDRAEKIRDNAARQRERGHG